MRLIAMAFLPLLLAACGFNGSDPDPGETPSASPRAAAASPAWRADPMASNDDVAGVEGDDKPRPIMQAQVVLDRLGFTPGVVDGKLGLSTANAVRGFQQANGLPQTGELDAATIASLRQWAHIPATRVVTIPAEFAAGPFYRDLPTEPAEQAKMPELGYRDLAEKLAERFHTTPETIVSLHDPAQGELDLDAGARVRVPNVGADRIDPAKVEDKAWLETLAMLGVGTDQPHAARVVVSKSNGTLKAYDAADKLIAVYTATMGSRHDPLPLGEWKILGVAHNPPFNYNPDLFWDAEPGDEKARLPPGPNGPVGVVWIDISKDHYGIHGTPEPQTIGRAQSHGCVRLTNWDAARLAQMVSTGTELLFEA